MPKTTEKIKEEMKEEIIKNCMEEKSCSKKCCKNRGGNPGAFYGLGFVGAVIYFIQHSHSFMDGVIGILKAMVWPAFVAYKFFEYFKF
jgi:hypothetical protein